jgi:hypothetical protein
MRVSVNSNSNEFKLKTLATLIDYLAVAIFTFFTINNLVYKNTHILI